MRRVDGPLLLKLDEDFAIETLQVTHLIQRRKLMQRVSQLKKAYEKSLQVMDLVVVVLIIASEKCSD
jgi:hypothetical protein